MINFTKKWNGVPVEDYGCVMSKQAKSFATSFRNMVKKNVPDGCTVKIQAGHYFVSGFVTSPEGKTVYVSYSIPRMETPVDCYANDPMFGVLIRYAKDDNDFTGGQNHFCSLNDLPNAITAMLA